MTIEKRLLSLFALLALSIMGVVSPRAVLGQDFSDDFMFHAPKATVSFNIGYGIPGAGSDLFDEVTDMFTLGKSDFRAPLIGGGLSIFLKDRIDLAFEFSYASSSAWSSYATGLPAIDERPIEHDTHFTRVPVTASFKYFLMDRGRQIGNLSWIPTEWAPYIGFGGGGMFYEFGESGEFIDEQHVECETLGCPIFHGDYLSKGWAWVGHAFGGLQWALSPQWIVTVEGRYSLSDADLDRPAYVDYEPIDLSGFQGTVGFGIRF